MNHQPVMRAKRLCVALAIAFIASGVAGADAGCYGTRTPYQSQQAAAYESPPPGYRIVHTQMLARHGSRGQSSAGPDLALLAVWQRAEREGALTPLGQALGADLRQFIEANERLGTGVTEVAKPGYGNLTALGRREHRELAGRMVARLPQLFAEVAARGEAASIQYSYSGVSRAKQSADAFLETLRDRVPGIAASIAATPAITAYPADAPKPQPPGVDRFTLYFHKLNEKTDLALSPGDPNSAIYQQSQAYQNYVHSEALAVVLSDIRAAAELRTASRNALERLFVPEFVDTIDVTKTATALYEVWSIAPLLQSEMHADFSRFLDPGTAQVFAEAEDAEDFYVKGPATAASDGVTYLMADQLLNDFFAAAEEVSNRNRPGAKLRFAHAETVIPFAVLLGIPEFSTPMSKPARYSHAGNPWRVAQVAPMAANVQWDTFRSPGGATLVRMLYNEREVDFKPACNDARWKSGSHFYDLARLRSCYRIPRLFQPTTDAAVRGRAAPDRRQI